MKKNVWIAPIVLVLALILNSCGTQQKATAPSPWLLLLKNLLSQLSL